MARAMARGAAGSNRRFRGRGDARASARAIDATDEFRAHGFRARARAESVASRRTAANHEWLAFVFRARIKRRDARHDARYELQMCSSTARPRRATRARRRSTTLARATVGRRPRGVAIESFESIDCVDRLRRSIASIETERVDRSMRSKQTNRKGRSTRSIDRSNETRRRKGRTNSHDVARRPSHPRAPRRARDTRRARKRPGCVRPVVDPDAARPCARAPREWRESIARRRFYALARRRRHSIGRHQRKKRRGGMRFVRDTRPYPGRKTATTSDTAMTVGSSRFATRRDAVRATDGHAGVPAARTRAGA